MSAAGPQPIHGRAVAAIVGVLDRERLMTLACNRLDGWPQATTVGYLNEGLNLYFIVSRASQKFANLQADSRASIAIRCESGSRGDAVGLSMAGRVHEVVDPVARTAQPVGGRTVSGRPRLLPVVGHRRRPSFPADGDHRRRRRRGPERCGDLHRRGSGYGKRVPAV